MIVVARLRVAPVKGLATVSPEQVRLDRGGVAEDRRLFLLRADGTLLTLREAPRLAAAVPHLDLGAGTVQVSLPDGSQAVSDLTAAAPEVHGRLFGKDRVGRVVPGPVAAAISALVGEPIRLVLAERTGVGWDDSPVSILARASAAAVAAPGADGAAGTRRFRMLVEVDGVEAHGEDTWIGRDVAIGTAVVRVSHALARCVVIQHDPATGAEDWPGLAALMTTRGRTVLGVVADVVRPGTVRVGDLVVPAGV